jgi:hypothetical protein
LGQKQKAPIASEERHTDQAEKQGQFRQTSPLSHFMRLPAARWQALDDFFASAMNLQRRRAGV